MKDVIVIMEQTRSSGFTLIEIIAVLVVLGIMATVIASGIGNIGSEAERIGEIARIKTHLRFAQAQSMAESGIFYGLEFKGDNYACYGFTALPSGLTAGTGGKLLRLPGEEADRVQLKSGLSIKSQHLICFTILGVPMEKEVSYGGSLDFGDGNSITITLDTGFIP